MPTIGELRRLLEAVRSAGGRDLPTITMDEVRRMAPAKQVSVYREFVHGQLRVLWLPEHPTPPVDPGRGRAGRCRPLTS